MVLQVKRKKEVNQEKVTMAKRAYSPREILKMTYKPIPWGGEWERCFGQPDMYDTWFISGPSAGGKSSFVMQLAKKLCEYGVVLYCSFEEKVSMSFKERIERFHMEEEQGRFRVCTDTDIDNLKRMLKQRKGPKFIIVDSFQYSHWEYAQVEALVNEFHRKSFIFISQEAKSQPLGKPAVRLKYMAGVKVRVVGYEAVCQGRFIGEAGATFRVWEDGLIQASNNI